MNPKSKAGMLAMMAMAAVFRGDEMPVIEPRERKRIDGPPAARFRPLTARERRQAKTTARHPHWHSRNRKQQSV